MFRFLIVLLFATSLLAQEPSGARKTLEAEHYGQWESLRDAGSLSGDGRWLVYSVTRSNRENELRLRRLANDELQTFPHGKDARFSDDGKWLGYLVGVSEKKSEKLKKRLWLRISPRLASITQW